jgi:hypothetical protein
MIVRPGQIAQGDEIERLEPMSLCSNCFFWSSASRKTAAAIHRIAP